MRSNGIVLISTNDLLILVSVGLILFVAVCWRLYYINGKREVDPGLTDGAVLLIIDGMVKQASDAAKSLLGPCENQPIVRVLDDFLGPNGREARDAVNQLEMIGEPLDILVRTEDGNAYEMIGAPTGAMIRLVIRDAALLDVKLRDAAERITAADTALRQRQLEQETLSGLISEAPMIAWHRSASGEVNWSGGEIKIRNSCVTANQAVELIVARTKLNRQPVLAGQPQKSRIEIVVNEYAETVSLHVVEIIRQDGSRIGVATDAGTAASAERTLTRFVQTMTETFAHLTVGLAIFDRNQTLALFNPALVQMWQVEPAWLARRPSLRDIIDELRTTRRLPELQDFHKWRSRLLGLFENTEAADYEDLWHLADGSNIRVLARPHPHGSLAFIFDDVTERVRLEQRYRHSIDLRRATLDRLNEGIAVFGANGLLQFVNQAFHDIWGTDSDTVYAAMHARQLVGLCEEITLDDQPWQKLHSFITGEESRRAWNTSLQMGSGRVLQLRVAPLPDGSTMTVFSDRGSDVWLDDQPAARLVTDQSADAPEGPDDPPAHLPKTCVLHEALQQTLDVLETRAATASTSITLGSVPNNSSVVGDSDQLRQIAFNLASAALRFADVGAGVQLGCDIADEQSFSIFVATRGTMEPGKGEPTLLSVARRFAERENGEIEVQSPADGSLRFVCRFRPEAASQTIDENTPRIGRRKTAGPKIVG